MNTKIKLTPDEIKTYGIRNQNDLDRLQTSLSEKMGSVVEFEPFNDEVTDDVKNYIQQKFGKEPPATTPPGAAPESAINTEDINNYLKSKK